MARKFLPKNLNTLRQVGESIFSMPNRMKGAAVTKPVYIRTNGLKPNTRYKVMIDNHPGNMFEDITEYSIPVGDSVKNNPKIGGKARPTYFKSDEEGRLDLRVRSYGTESATYSTAGGMRFDNLWKYFNTRSRDEDRLRNKVKLIAYNHVKNPSSTQKIKELKNDVSGTVVTGGTYGYGTLPPIRPEDAVPPGIICDCTFGLPGIVNSEIPIHTRARYYQTFYVDADSVDGSDYCDITDIELFFRRKPGYKNNRSGRRGPGVRVHILPCNSDGTPNMFTRYRNGSSKATWHQCKVSGNATAPTVFKFHSPVTVKTNRYYAIAVQEEDDDYIVWENKKGHRELINGVKRESISQGSSKGHRGQLFFYNNLARLRPGQSMWNARPELDIKFNVNIAQYRVNDIDVTLVNKPYEFFNVSSTAATWAPGERVYKSNVANGAGTVSMARGSKKITGIGTDFSSLRDGECIVISNSADSDDTQIFTVNRSIGSSSSTTVLYVNEWSASTIAAGSTYKITVVGELEIYDPVFNAMRLAESSVNWDQYNYRSEMLFEPGDTIKGEETGTTAVIDDYNELPVSVFRSDWNATLPAQFKPTTYYNLTKENASYTGNTDQYSISSDDKIFFMNAPNHVKDYEGLILSRSQEVIQTDSGIVNTGGLREHKSAEILLNYQYQGANTKVYQAPTLTIDEVNMITHRWYINNDGDYEYLNEGNANTRHISKTLEMGNDAKAEDIRVYMNAYRPKGTKIEAYAKIINSSDPDAFDDKQWTKLVLINGGSEFSNKEELYDYRELEFTWPDFPDYELKLDGTFTTNVGDTTVQIESANNTQIDALTSGDIIRIYSPLFDDTYQLFSVNSANSTAGTITLNEPVSNTSLEGDGFLIETVKAQESAFRNPDNYNICRYFNSRGTIYDTYNKVAIKIVLLAESRKLVPKVDDYRVIAVSA